MADAAPSNADTRRSQILTAAFDCFIRYGYSKIAMQDVAKSAGVSRPLIYTFYNGKEDLFLAMFEAIFADQLSRIRAVASTDLPARDRLTMIFEITYLELWEKFTGSAEGADLLDAAGRLFPKIATGHSAAVVKILASILGDAKTAQNLLLSGKGVCYDRPSTSLLRERLGNLIDIFLLAGLNAAKQN